MKVNMNQTLIKDDSTYDDPPYPNITLRDMESFRSKPANSTHIKNSLNFFFFWVINSKTDVFYDTPPLYNEFYDEITSLDSDEQRKFLINVIDKFQKESQNHNPLETILSYIINWDLNFNLVLKDFIPYVIKAAPNVKFKRFGCLLQTNNTFYLFPEAFQKIIAGNNWNKPLSDEIISDSLAVYLSIRYRQTFGEKDHTYFEEVFFKAYQNISNQINLSNVSSFKDAFYDFREKMHLQNITNEQLTDGIKALQNLLGKNAMSSTKKTTFFWQMYVDLKCVNAANYVSPYQTSFFIDIQTDASTNKVFINFNKDYFQAMKKLGLVERIEPLRVIFLYVLYNLNSKLKDIYFNDFDNKGAPFISALMAADPIFKNFTPFIEEFETYLKKQNNKEAMEHYFNSIVELLNDKLSFQNLSELSFFTNFILKERLGLLSSEDRRKIYQPFF